MNKNRITLFFKGSSITIEKVEKHEALKVFAHSESVYLVASKAEITEQNLREIKLNERHLELSRTLHEEFPKCGFQNTIKKQFDFKILHFKYYNVKGIYGKRVYYYTLAKNL